MDLKRDGLVPAGILLGFFLGLWVIGLGNLLSYRWWLRGFTRETPILDVDSPIQGAFRREADLLIIEGATDRSAVVRLGNLRPDEDGDYLVTGRAAGRELIFQLLPTDSGAPLRQFNLRPGLHGTPLAFAVQAGGLPSEVRFRILNRSPGEARIAGLTVYHLHPGYRLMVPAGFAVGPCLLVGFALRYRRWLAGYLRSRPAAERPGDWLVAAAILCSFFVVYRYSPVHQLTDYKFSSAVSHFLLAEGRLSLPPEFGPAQGSGPYQLFSANGRVHHLFPSAHAILNAPLVFFFERFGLAPVFPNGEFRSDNESRILTVAAAGSAALLCAVLFLLGRVWLRPRECLAMVAVFGFGTQIYSTMSRPFWGHTWAAVLLAAAIYLLASPRLSRRGWCCAAAATLLSWSYFCRPTMSLSIVAITALVALRRRRSLPCLLGVGATWLVLFAAHSIHTYGEWLPPYFLSSHLVTGRFGIETLARSYPEAVLGTLVSPGRGLFVFVPMYALVLVAVRGTWRTLPCRGLAVGGLAVIVLHWQLVSSFQNWWGGQSFGPRLFSELAVWFFVLAALATAAYRSRVEVGGPRLSAWKTAVAVSLVAASIFINVRGATSKATLRWETDKGIGAVGLIFPPRSAVFPNSRLWDWSRPQFLAGLRPGPPKRDAANAGRNGSDVKQEPDD